MITPTLTPACGRDYKSKKDAIIDLEKNMDFIYNDISSQWNAKPCNLQDLACNTLIVVKVRYNKNTKVFVYTIKAKP